MKLDFEKMCFVKKVYWKIRLWLMDHRLPFFYTHPSILEPSYYYTHTVNERYKEIQRRKEELLCLIDVLSMKNDTIKE